MNKKGFTIVETLIAIGILMAAIAGPIAISQKSLKTGLITKDNMVATYLAEEAMEVIKAKISYNVFKNGIASWNDGLTNGSYAAIRTEDFEIDNDAGSKKILWPDCPLNFYGLSGSVDSDCYMTFNSDKGYYSYEDTAVVPNTSVSQYIRNVIIGPVPGSSDEIRVTVNVIQMTSGNSINTYSLTRNFYKF